MVKTQNNKDGDPIDGTSGILRVTPNGQPVGEGILGDTLPLRFTMLTVYVIVLDSTSIL